VTSRIPIRIRVAAAFAVCMAAVLAATGLFLYARLDSHLTTVLNHNLLVRAEDVAALVRHPGGSLARDAGSLVEPGENYAQLVDASGRVVDATRPLGSNRVLSPAEVRRGLREKFYANRESVPGLDEPSRFLATPMERDGRRFVLVVGATRQDRSEALAALRDELLIAGPIALVLATLTGYLLAGVALRPVERMRRSAAAISADTPGERLPVPPTGDELERLGQTLNAMLERLETALARERDFVADAGHELRTPLALLRTELELALRHDSSSDELREAVRRASVEVDRLGQLAEDLLLIARSERGRLPLQVEPIEATDLLDAVVTRFGWRAHEAGRRVEAVPAPGLALEGDRIRLEQALGNLVENALRYGEGDVRLSAGQVDGVVELHVADDGSGFPPAFLARAFERFTRADHARSSGGAGLGLAIVQVIAEAHGGSAHAANRDAGGADVWLAVPETAI
jgi:heavy metal sensor kinase